MHPLVPGFRWRSIQATGRCFYARQYNGVPGTKASNAAQNWERK